MKAKRIFLLGFMGTGKSTVAVYLAKTLGWQLIELDKKIEENMGQTIAESFANQGEEYFRGHESTALRDTKDSIRSVISCGGGIVLDNKNSSWMKENGVTVLLTATPQTIYNRINKSSQRPILKDQMNIESITEILESRKIDYISAAQIVVATDDKSILQITKEIIHKLEVEQL